MGDKVWKIGVGICWDQWFPECARSMALLGADILFYPTAIGSEPILTVDSMPHWKRTMQGHAAANIVPVVAANRIGLESVTPCEEMVIKVQSFNFMVLPLSRMPKEKWLLWPHETMKRFCMPILTL